MKASQKTKKQLVIEIEQLKHALKESQTYADKLVEGIPYLPADIKNLRAANADFEAQLQDMKKLNETLKARLNEALRTLKLAEHVTDTYEYPGPYKLEYRLGNYRVVSACGDEILRTDIKSVAEFIMATLTLVQQNAWEKIPG